MLWNLKRKQRIHFRVRAEMNRRQILRFDLTSAPNSVLVRIAAFSERDIIENDLEFINTIIYQFRNKLAIRGRGKKKLNK